MSMQDNAKTSRMMFDCFNNRDYDRALQSVDPNCEIVDMATGQTLRGHEGFRQSMQGWATAFPDAKVEVTNVISGGDWVAVEFKGRGTHNGPLMGPTGEIPATGRKLDHAFCELHHYRNGKMVRSHLYWDMAGMMNQLGLMPKMKQAGR